MQSTVTRTRLRNVLSPEISEIPEPPEAFGEDGGRFYQSYDDLAEEMDEDTAVVLKDQLDGVIIFAGLFASVITTFLILTIPMLWAEDIQDTNALIRQTNAILLQIAMGRNDSLPTEVTLPSELFAADTMTITFVALFSLSLTFTLLSSFFAMIGRQWLVYYRKRGGGGPDQRRWGQLQRFLGAQRWHLELILGDVVPSLLQIALITFCIALVLYLQTISLLIAWIVSISLLHGGAFFFGTALCTIWDKFCPFHSSLSRFFHSILHYILVILILLNRIFTSLFKSRKEASSATHSSRLNRTPFGIATVEIELQSPSNKLGHFEHAETPTIGREEEALESLQVVALQRVIDISEDPASLLNAVANIPSICNPTYVRMLWEETQFQGSLLSLYVGSYDRTLRLLGRKQVDLALEAKRLYGAAITHIFFYLAHMQSASAKILPCLRAVERFDSLATRSLEIPDNTPVIFVHTSLAHALMCIHHSSPSTQDVQALCAHLNSCSDYLRSSDWKLLSLISWAIAQLPVIKSLRTTNFEPLSRAFMGDTNTLPDNINQAFEVILTRRDVNTLDCERVLANLLRSTYRVVTDECPHPGIRVDQTLILLNCAERALRSASWPDEVRTLVRRMRSVVVEKFKERHRCTSTLYGEITIISPELLDALISLFQTLRMAISSSGQSYQKEDADVIAQFRPIVEEILLEDTVFKWENQDCSPEDRPEGLTQRLDTLEETFEQFKSDVFKCIRQQEDGSANLTSSGESGPSNHGLHA